MLASRDWNYLTISSAQEAVAATDPEWRDDIPWDSRQIFLLWMSASRTLCCSLSALFASFSRAQRIKEHRKEADHETKRSSAEYFRNKWTVSPKRAQKQNIRRRVNLPYPRKEVHTTEDLLKAEFPVSYFSPFQHQDEGKAETQRIYTNQSQPDACQA